MHRVLVAAALVVACRGSSPRAHKDAGLRGSASAVSDAAVSSVVPKLPRSEDGVAALRALDRSIEAANDLRTSIPLRLERAWIRGRLEDYQQAVADSATLVKQSPLDENAWRLRVDALQRVHEFRAARDAMKHLAKLVNPKSLVESELELAAATGDMERALAGRAELAQQFGSPQRLTLLAATLAQAGRTGEAIALIPKAAAAVRDNPPTLLAWLLFQWGRIYELDGKPAIARDFFAAAHARLPGYVEATTHLAQTMIATGDRAGATRVIDEALETSRYPELLALGAELGKPQLAGEARKEWERYVAALPLAFSDHAARFYVTRDPARALELAKLNHANRDTKEARALVVEAALAAGDAKAACAVVDPLVTGGTRAQRFVAWQALSRCGRAADAQRLGSALGIGSAH